MSTDTDPQTAPAEISPETIPPQGSKRFMLNLGILSFSVLFAASITAYLFIRLNQTNWPPEGMPSMPITMWLSTFLIIGCSMLLQLGLSNIRNGRPSFLKTSLLATLVLAVVFLINQVASWLPLIQANIVGQANVYTFTFFMLIGLHALHLLGGVIPLAYVTQAATKGFYSQDSYEGVELLVRYWHFLGIVWLILFATLLATS